MVVIGLTFVIFDTWVCGLVLFVLLIICLLLFVLLWLFARFCCTCGWVEGLACGFGLGFDGCFILFACVAFCY